MKIVNAYLLLALTVLTPQISYAFSWQENCKAMEGIGSSIMKARQSGTPMSKSIEIADKAGDPALKKLIESLVIEAYDSPRYSTAGMQGRAQEDFANSVYLRCAKSTNK